MFITLDLAHAMSDEMKRSVRQPREKLPRHLLENPS